MVTFIIKYLHSYFHFFNILKRTNEVHSSMNIVSLITAQRYGKNLMASGIPRYFIMFRFKIASIRDTFIIFTPFGTVKSPNS